ncbi:MAG: MarR family winged helix-turn-helix transcriptional regulator [Gemmatimonadaceae bacterium]
MNRNTAPFAVEEANDSSGFLIWQVTMIWQRRIAAVLRPFELTQVQFTLLASLLWLSRRERPITQAMLARHAKLDMMMTSQVLRALERHGLLERHPHPTDTRARALTLTRRGRALTRRAVPEVESADRSFFSALGRGLERFNDALIALIDTSA